MKHSVLVFRICTVIAVAAGLAAVSNGQNREKFGISAKAGGINTVAGRVMVTRAGQEPQLLSNQDDLVSGDLVSTGTESQAEILLNPGSYLRLAENSELTLVDNSLENLLVRLTRGSAIIEATGTDYSELRIGVAIGQERVMIVRRGIYRLTVQPRSTELLVRKGRVVLENASHQVVKGGKLVTFTGGSVFTAKLEKAQPDQFDNWSKERAKTLARANDKLSSRMLNGYLASNTFGWSSAFGRLGLWTFSPFLRCYTFLPFYDGWASPYGSYYGSLWPFYDYFDRGGCCGGRRFTRPPAIVRNPSTFGGSGGGAYGGSGGGANPSPGMRSPTVIPMPSQAGPRDPDSGSRGINRIRNPE